jgi:hypothetical protein
LVTPKDKENSHKVEQKKDFCTNMFPIYGDINRWSPPLQFQINGREVIDYRKYRMKNEKCAKYCCKYLFISNFFSAWIFSIFFIAAVVLFLRRQFNTIGAVLRVAEAFMVYVPWTSRGDDFCLIM